MVAFLGSVPLEGFSVLWKIASDAGDAKANNIFPVNQSKTHSLLTSQVSQRNEIEGTGS